MQEGGDDGQAHQLVDVDLALPEPLRRFKDDRYAVDGCRGESEGHPPPGGRDAQIFPDEAGKRQQSARAAQHKVPETEKLSVVSDMRESSDHPAFSLWSIV